VANGSACVCVAASDPHAGRTTEIQSRAGSATRTDGQISLGNDAAVIVNRKESQSLGIWCKKKGGVEDYQHQSRIALWQCFSEAVKFHQVRREAEGR
jgi:hypothetical protein